MFCQSCRSAGYEPSWLRRLYEGNGSHAEVQYPTDTETGWLYGRWSHCFWTAVLLFGYEHIHPEDNWSNYYILSPKPMIGSLMLGTLSQGFLGFPGIWWPMDQGVPASFCKVWPGWQWKVSSRGAPTTLGELAYSDANLGHPSYNGWRHSALIGNVLLSNESNLERSRVKIFLVKDVKKSQPWGSAEGI